MIIYHMTPLLYLNTTYKLLSTPAKILSKFGIALGISLRIIVATGSGKHSFSKL